MLRGTDVHALVIFALLTLVTGVALSRRRHGYSRSCVRSPIRPAGSLIERDGEAVGSRLLGQSFTQPAVLLGRGRRRRRRSLTTAAVSSGSNQGADQPEPCDTPCATASPRCVRPTLATRRRFRSIS